MLGRLRMSVIDCIQAYLTLSKAVFRKTKHRVKLNGELQARFESDELTRAIKKVIKQQGYQEDALLQDDQDNACKVYVNGMAF